MIDLSDVRGTHVMNPQDDSSDSTAAALSAVHDHADGDSWRICSLPTAPRKRYSRSHEMMLRWHSNGLYGTGRHDHASARSHAITAGMADAVYCRRVNVV